MYAYCLLMILGGYGFVLLYTLFLLFIHDLGHYVMVLIMRQRVNCILVYPFGLSMHVENMEYSNSIYEILIAMGGPLSIYISSFLLYMFYRWDLISISFYEYLFDLNFNIFLFNILPIYPLDGGRILHGLCHYLFNYKWSYVLCLFISLIFALAFLIIFDVSILHLYIFILVVLLFFKYSSLDSTIRKFHFYRYVYPLNDKKRVKNKSNVLYRNKRSFMIYYNQDEQVYLRHIFMRHIHK